MYFVRSIYCSNGTRLCRPGEGNQLALAAADRGPLSRLPEVAVLHVLGFAIALFK